MILTGEKIFFAIEKPGNNIMLLITEPKMDDNV